jgi:glycyl-tRNA synthetase
LYRKDAKAVEVAVEALTQDTLEKLSIGLRSEGKIDLDVDGVGKVKITKDLINIGRRTRVENVREFTPNVIEPSFVSAEYFMRSASTVTGRALKMKPAA